MTTDERRDTGGVTPMAGGYPLQREDKTLELRIRALEARMADAAAEIDELQDRVQELESPDEVPPTVTITKPE